MSSLIEEAMMFAATKHSGQVRKYTGVPYITHPCAVAGLVASVSNDEEMVAAAFLHDVIEDCGINDERLKATFGPRVAALVAMVTDTSRPSDGNRRVRKRIDLEHLAQGCPEAKTIKLADIIDNTSTILAYDPQFAAVYLREKQELLPHLEEGSETLYNLAFKMVYK